MDMNESSTQNHAEFDIGKPTWFWFVSSLHVQSVYRIFPVLCISVDAADYFINGARDLLLSVPLQCENTLSRSRPGGHRCGYMGHLTRIANHIAENLDKGPNAESIKEHFQGKGSNSL